LEEWCEEIAKGAETWFYRSPDEFWEVLDDHLTVMN
jgi:hypothetical protein